MENHSYDTCMQNYASQNCLKNNLLLHSCHYMQAKQMFLTSHTTAAYSYDGDDYNKEDYPPYDSNNGRNGVCGMSHNLVTVLKI